MPLKEANWGESGICFSHQTLAFTGRSLRHGVRMGGGYARTGLCHYLTRGCCVLKPRQNILLQAGFFVAGARRRCGTLLNTPWSCGLAGLYLPSPEFWIEAIWEEKLLSQENKWDLAGLWVRNVPSCHLKPWPKRCESGSGRGHLL